jgi:hypothetical protein
MKKHTQRAFRDPARQDQQPRKLRLDAETLRVLTGGGRVPGPESPSTRRSQCPTLCFE